MPFYKIEWPQQPGEEHWGQHTDWIIRAPDLETALKIAGNDPGPEGGGPTEHEVRGMEVPLEGPSEIILWYGHDT